MSRAINTEKKTNNHMWYIYLNMEPNLNVQEVWNTEKEDKKDADLAFEQWARHTGEDMLPECDSSCESH